MWTISLPLRVPVSKKKLWSLNLNQYRNTHFQTLNKAKAIFTKSVKSQLKGIPRLKRITLKYTVYAPSAQLFDTNNICSIVDKFFQDALIHAGIIEDDHYKIVVGTQFLPGGIDRGNPRVEVEIDSPDTLPVVPPEPVREERRVPTMKIKTVIILTVADLNKALTDYMASNGVTIPEGADVQIGNPDAEGQVSVTFEASKGGVQASSKPTQAAKPTPAAKPTTVNKVAEKPAQKPVQTALEPQPETVQEPAPEVAETTQPEPGPTEEAPPAEAKPKRPSLFADVKKPVNA